MKIALVAFSVGLLALGVIGCATSSQVPRGAMFVGGGLSINYVAPRDGTAILIERTSGRIVATESVAEGDSFSFEPDDSEAITVLRSMFGTTNEVQNGEYPMMPTNTFFQLYFLPTK